ncbi:MAG: prepilin-type N-terminal cleavage/methylation domain-containing protein [Chthonomonas sp.]|nr:prepilin-type N-terminal cleavage/methylation domain-containing protein [Chthonomonas sp.]
MRLKKAFTLIELLVVIAIIAILAAILFPVFAQAKAAAKKAAATSNLKQSALATLMYADNYDDTYPMAAYSTGVGGMVEIPLKAVANVPLQIVSAFDAIFPYTKSKELFQDPGDPQAIPWRDAILTPMKAASPAGIIYAGTAFNFSLFQDTAVVKAIGGSATSATVLGDPVVSASALTAPADTVMFYSAGFTKATSENKFYQTFKTSWDNTVKANPATLLLADYIKPKNAFGRHNFAAAPRHSSQVVINYADGHVSVKSATASLPGKATYAAKEYAVYNLPFDLNGIPDLNVEPNIEPGF